MDSQERLSLRMPRHLDDPEKFLWWDFDVVLVSMGIVFFGVVGGMLTMGIILGILSGRFYNSFKSGKSKGFTVHMSYWYLPISLNLKVVPDSDLRFFVG